MAAFCPDQALKRILTMFSIKKIKTERKKWIFLIGGPDCIAVLSTMESLFRFKCMSCPYVEFGISRLSVISYLSIFAKVLI